MTTESMGPNQFKAMQELLHSKLENLSTDKFWKGHLIVNEKGDLESVNLIKYLPHLFETKEAKSKAVIKLLSNYKDFCTTNDLGLINGLAKKTGLTDDASVKELIDAITKDVATERKTEGPEKKIENLNYAQPSKSPEKEQFQTGKEGFAQQQEETQEKASNEPQQNIPKKSKPADASKINIPQSTHEKEATKNLDSDSLPIGKVDKNEKQKIIPSDIAARDFKVGTPNTDNVGKNLDEFVDLLHQRGDPGTGINSFYNMNEAQKAKIPTTIHESLSVLYNLQGLKHDIQITPCAYDFLVTPGFTSSYMDYSQPGMLISIDSNPPKTLEIPFSLLAIFKNSKMEIQNCCRADQLKITPSLLLATSGGELEIAKAPDQFLSFLKDYEIPQDKCLSLFKSFRANELFQNIPLGVSFHQQMFNQMSKVKNNNFNKELYEYAKMNAPQGQTLLQWLDTVKLSPDVKTQASVAINKYVLPPKLQDGYDEAQTLRDACYGERRTIGSLICARDDQGVFTITDKNDPSAKLVFYSDKFESTLSKETLQRACTRLNQENLVSNCEVYCATIPSVHSGGSGDTLSFFLGENGKFYTSMPESFPSVNVNFASKGGRSWGGDSGEELSFLPGEHKLKINVSEQTLNESQKESIKGFMNAFDQEKLFEGSTGHLNQAAVYMLKSNMPLLTAPFLTLTQQIWNENSPKGEFEGNFVGNKELLINLFQKTNLSKEQVAQFLKDNNVRAGGGFFKDPQILAAFTKFEPKGVSAFYTEFKIQ